MQLELLTLHETAITIQEALLDTLRTNLERKLVTTVEDYEKFTSEDWAAKVLNEAEADPDYAREETKLETLRAKKNLCMQTINASQTTSPPAPPPPPPSVPGAAARRASLFVHTSHFGDDQIVHTGYDIRKAFTTSDMYVDVFTSVGSMKRVALIVEALEGLRPSWELLLLDTRGMWNAIMALLTPEKIQQRRAALKAFFSIRMTKDVRGNHEKVGAFIKRFDATAVLAYNILPSLRDFLTEDVRAAMVLEALVQSQQPHILAFISNFEGRRSEKQRLLRDDITVDALVQPLIDKEAELTALTSQTSTTAATHATGKTGGKSNGKKGGGNNSKSSSNDTTSNAKAALAVNSSASAIGQTRTRNPSGGKAKKGGQGGGGGGRGGGGSGGGGKGGGNTPSGKKTDGKTASSSNHDHDEKCKRCSTWWHGNSPCPYPPDVVVCFKCKHHGHIHNHCPDSEKSASPSGGKPRHRDGTVPGYKYNKTINHVTVASNPAPPAPAVDPTPTPAAAPATTATISDVATVEEPVYNVRGHAVSSVTVPLVADDQPSFGGLTRVDPEIMALNTMGRLPVDFDSDTESADGFHVAMVDFAPPLSAHRAAPHGTAPVVSAADAPSPRCDHASPDLHVVSAADASSPRRDPASPAHDVVAADASSPCCDHASPAPVASPIRDDAATVSALATYDGDDAAANSATAAPSPDHATSAALCSATSWNVASTSSSLDAPLGANASVAQLPAVEDLARASPARIPHGSPPTADALIPAMSQLTTGSDSTSVSPPCRDEPAPESGFVDPWTLPISPAARHAMAISRLEARPLPSLDSTLRLVFPIRLHGGADSQPSSSSRQSRDEALPPLSVGGKNQSKNKRPRHGLSRYERRKRKREAEAAAAAAAAAAADVENDTDDKIDEPTPLHTGVTNPSLSRDGDYGMLDDLDDEGSVGAGVTTGEAVTTTTTGTAVAADTTADSANEEVDEEEPKGPALTPQPLFTDLTRVVIDPVMTDSTGECEIMNLIPTHLPSMTLAVMDADSGDCEGETNVNLVFTQPRLTSRSSFFTLPSSTATIREDVGWKHEVPAWYSTNWNPTHTGNDANGRPLIRSLAQFDHVGATFVRAPHQCDEIHDESHHHDGRGTGLLGYGTHMPSNPSLVPILTGTQELWDYLESINASAKYISRVENDRTALVLADAASRSYRSKFRQYIGDDHAIIKPQLGVEYGLRHLGPTICRAVQLDAESAYIQHLHVTDLHPQRTRNPTVIPTWEVVEGDLRLVALQLHAIMADHAATVQQSTVCWACSEESDGHRTVDCPRLKEIRGNSKAVIFPPTPRDILRCETMAKLVLIHDIGQALVTLLMTANDADHATRSRDQNLNVRRSHHDLDPLKPYDFALESWYQLEHIHTMHMDARLGRPPRVVSNRSLLASRPLTSINRLPPASSELSQCHVHIVLNPSESIRRHRFAGATTTVPTISRDPKSIRTLLQDFHREMGKYELRPRLGRWASDGRDWMEWILDRNESSESIQAAIDAVPEIDWLRMTRAVYLATRVLRNEGDLNKVNLDTRPPVGDTMISAILTGHMSSDRHDLPLRLDPFFAQGPAFIRDLWLGVADTSRGAPSASSLHHASPRRPPPAIRARPNEPRVVLERPDVAMYEPLPFWAICDEEWDEAIGAQSSKKRRRTKKGKGKGPAPPTVPPAWTGTLVDGAGSSRSGGGWTTGARPVPRSRQEGGWGAGSSGSGGGWTTGARAGPRARGWGAVPAGTDAGAAGAGSSAGAADADVVDTSPRARDAGGWIGTRLPRSRADGGWGANDGAGAGAGAHGDKDVDTSFHPDDDDDDNDPDYPDNPGASRSYYPFRTRRRQDYPGFRTIGPTAVQLYQACVNEAIHRRDEMDPRDPDYLRACGHVAMARRNHATAEQAYRAGIRVGTEDFEVERTPSPDGSCHTPSPPTSPTSHSNSAQPPCISPNSRMTNASGAVRQLRYAFGQAQLKHTRLTIALQTHHEGEPATPSDAWDATRSELQAELRAARSAYDTLNARLAAAQRTLDRVQADLPSDQQLPRNSDYYNHPPDPPDSRPGMYLNRYEDFRDVYATRAQQQEEREAEQRDAEARQAAEQAYMAASREQEGPSRTYRRGSGSSRSRHRKHRDRERQRERASSGRAPSHASVNDDVHVHLLRYVHA